MLTRNERGLTLLSMIVTLAILSMIAFSTVALTDNADQQSRYEETRARLGQIRRAMTGERNAVYAGQALLSGFVPENGLLPATLGDLFQTPTGFDTFGVRSPIFDPDPDLSTGINNGGAETALGAPNERLLKGHRPYLYRPVGGGGYFDGWGNRGAPPNDGWVITADATHFQSESLGAEGAVGGAGIYAQDMADDVVGNDWAQTLDGWGVTLLNKTGGEITLTPPLRVSLLVYVNDADSANAYNWRRITSNPIVGVIPDGGFVTATFPDTAPDTFVPIGEHLLMAINDPDGTPHTGDDTPYLNADGSRASEQAVFFPMTTRPGVTLTLR